MVEQLPEATLLYDARGVSAERGRHRGVLVRAEIWSLLVSPAARILYAGRCSFLGHGEINGTDFRNALKNCSNVEVPNAFEELVHRNLLAPKPAFGDSLASYAVRSVQEEFEN